jgi:type II secretory pathway component GspD/PulD (secretin)
VDNIEAKIEIVQKIPYTEMQESSQGGSTTGTSYIDIGTRLFVTAHITSDGHISMHLRPSQEIQVGGGFVRTD